MLRYLIASAAFLLSVPAFAAEPPRFALVADTAPEGALTPILEQNAARVAEALSAAGYDVELRDGLDAAGLRHAVREFAGRIEATRGEAEAVLYLAGPMLQANGRNYLIARGTDVRRKSDVPLEGLAVGDVMSALAAAPAKARLIMLDATAGPVVAGIEPGVALTAAAKGTFVAVSAAPGEALPDGEAAARFSTAFANAMNEGVSDVQATFERVQADVSKESGGVQVPSRMGALVEPFMLGVKPSAKTAPASVPAAPAAETSSAPAAVSAQAEPPPAPPADATEPPPAADDDGPQQTASIPPEEDEGPGSAEEQGSDAAAPPSTSEPPVASVPQGATSEPSEPGDDSDGEAAATAPPNGNSIDASLPPRREETSIEAPAPAAPAAPLPPVKPKPPRVASIQRTPPTAIDPPGFDPRQPGRDSSGAQIVRPSQPGLNPGYLVYLGPRAAYRLVTREGSQAAYNAFLRAYPNHPLSTEIRARLGTAGAQRSNRTSNAAPPRPPGPSPFAAPPAGYGYAPPGFD